jgi:hypothetical protein
VLAELNGEYQHVCQYDQRGIASANESGWEYVAKGCKWWKSHNFFFAVNVGSRQAAVDSHKARVSVKYTKLLG